MSYRNKKLIASAEHVPCVSCGFNSACWCHSNQYLHGKGRGLKAHDLFGFYGCQNCHDWVDGRVKSHQDPNVIKLAHYEGAFETMIKLKNKGLITL